MKVIMIAAGVASLGMIALSNTADAMPVSQLDAGYSDVIQAHYRVIYRCPSRGRGAYGYERGYAPSGRGRVYGYTYGEEYRTRVRPGYRYGYGYSERYGTRGRLGYGGRNEGSRAFMERREEGRYGARREGAMSERREEGRYGARREGAMSERREEGRYGARREGAMSERREQGRYGAGASNREYGGRREDLTTGRSSAQGRSRTQGGSPGMMNRGQGGSTEGRSVSPGAPRGQQQTPQTQRGGGSGGQSQGGGTL